MSAVSEAGKARRARVASLGLGALAAGRQLLSGWARLWARPVWAGSFALIIYTVIAAAHHPVLQPTSTNYYDYLANAFLHGQLWLRQVPHQTRDLVYYRGHYALYWGPLPAVLLMPAVAFFGIGVSDVLTSVVVGAINVALIAAILQVATVRRVAPLSRDRRGILVLFFALGTVAITLAPQGRVWSLDQLFGFMWVALAYLAALRLRGWRAFLLTGLALSGAVLTRNHLVLTGIWPAWYLIHEHWDVRWRGLIGRLLVAGAPIVGAVGLLGIYDWARFGNPLNVGIPYHLMNPAFRPDYARYGFLSLHYVPINLFYQYVFYPLPMRADSLMGGSLFLMSPVFFLALAGIWLGRRHGSTWALVGSIMLVNVPILLLMGTGWMQYGP
ncbi:MAG TPA: hypothetical protein VFN57_09470, partial [Thermomicrobiaceae bacterium]|nr:hypothetical protein [Thermomicrobiaceae bacterium]